MDKHQLFDKSAKLIDKESKVFQKFQVGNKEKPSLYGQFYTQLEKNRQKMNYEKSRLAYNTRSTNETEKSAVKRPI